MKNTKITKGAEKLLKRMENDINKMEFSDSNLVKLDTVFKNYAYFSSGLNRNSLHANKALSVIDFVQSLSENDSKYYVDFIMALLELYDTDKYPLYDYIGLLYEMCLSTSVYQSLSFYPFYLNIFATEISFQKRNTDFYSSRIDYCASGGNILAFAKVASEKGIDYHNKAFVYVRDFNPRNIILAYVQTDLAGIPAVIRHCDMQTDEILDLGIFYNSAYLTKKDKIDKELEKK